ncbi:unnamed protein product [Rotaria sordida]|uniref:Uncharacterized protein n=1 Tax=Rotaria sordida TaxID=392033 RepID=A0A818VGB9_9BILA|nr:unnamed protein product [Rotaria sordida]CAF3712502.1 unnamed protein product [Rotaria sordida]
MLASFPSAVNPRRKAAYISIPILSICCLLLAVFLIASTVLLSLIPIFLPKKDVSWTSPTYFLTIDFDGSLGSDGSLDSAAREAFASKVAEALGLPEGAVIVIRGIVATEASKRKRRGLPLSRFRRGITSLGRQRIHLEYRFDETRCSSTCRSPTFVTRLPITTISVEFIYNGVRFVITGRIDFSSGTQLSIPSTLAAEAFITTVTETTTITTTTTETTVSLTPSVG